jgi:endonuclease/exonuclease/phosphatase family metal-dependent hydrolase
MSKQAAPNHQHESEVTPKAPRIRLATWNIRGFARPELADLAAVLNARRQNPEPLSLIVVQELQRAQAKKLARYLGMEHFWSFKHSPLGPLVRFAEGLALFSVHPLSRMETLDLTPRMQRFRHRRRISQFAYVQHIDADVVNVHLASHTNSSARIDQLQLVLDRIALRGPLRCIVAGDFNAAHEPELYALLENAGFCDVWLVNGTASIGSGFTNPAGSTKSRLDRIFVRGFTVDSVEVPTDEVNWAKRSDHLPVFACLEPLTRTALPTIQAQH